MENVMRLKGTFHEDSVIEQLTNDQKIHFNTSYL